MEQDSGFRILRKNNVAIPRHVESIFNELNLNGLRLLSNVDPADLNLIETGVKELLAGDDYLATSISQDEDRKTMFGPFFWKKPKTFKFTAGDKKAIEVMVGVAKQLVSEMKLVPRVQQKPGILLHNIELIVMDW